MNLGQKAQSAVIWNTGFNLFRDLLQFGVMLVLVRLLKPEAYGQFGLVTSIMGFITMFSFNQFLAHSLQVRDDSEVRYQNHFTAGIVIQGALFVIANLIALALHWFPTYATVAPLIHLMSLTIIVSVPNDVRVKMLERDGEWKRFRLLHGLALVVTSGISIVMAFAGAGVYALLAPSLFVAAPFIYDLFVTVRWRPDWSWSAEQYKLAMRFGLVRIGSGVFVSGRQMLESTVLAGALGFETLGFVNRAIGLSQMFCHKFAVQLMYSLYPLLTRLDPGKKNPARVSALVLRTVAWVVVPIGAIFGALALPVVKTVYGSKWVSVVPILPFAMLVSVATSIGYAAYMLLLSNQQERRCLAADAMTLGGTALALFACLPTGITQYLAGLAIVQFVIFTLASRWLIQIRALTGAGLTYALLPPLLATIMGVGFCETFRHLTHLRIESITVTVTYGTVFGIVYVGTLRVFFARSLAEIVAYFPGRKHFDRLLVLQDG